MNNAALDNHSLVYTHHARIRSREHRIPIYRTLPASACLWRIDRERGSSSYLLNHSHGAVCLVVSDIASGVVVTAYPLHH